MSNLIGTNPDQVPVNGMLGDLAFQDIDSVKITDLTYTGTLTGSTGILNIGSGQVYKDASGNVGIGTTAPSTKLTVAGATTISVTDNTNAALRITQLGTGNALVVEDSANPDSTPFVIDASGRVFIGATTNAGSTSTGLAPRVQIVGTGATTGDANSTSTLGVYRFFNDNGGPICAFFKSNSATPNTFASVNNNDTLGSIFWQADDGASFPRAASISAAVDGTPDTNDMPGRLVFSTTADGASSPTERMRIRSDGNVSIGGSGASTASLYLQKNITGGITGYGLYNRQTIQSDVTLNVYGYSSEISTQATAFTLTNLNHYYAVQATLGAGSAVTNQYGFNATSSLTGATNNYGFYGNIASGTGRYNLYMAGTANNYFAGNVGIGTSSPAQKLSVAGTIESTTGGVKFPDGTTQTTAAPASSIAVTAGDFTLSGNTGTNITNATLATVNTAGTYKSVTTDAKGRVTSGTNPTTLSGYGITDALNTTSNTSVPLVNGSVSSATASTTTTTASQVIDTNAIATYRSVSYVMQVAHSGGSWQTCSLNIVHDGTNAYITEWGNMNIGAVTTSLAGFDASIVSTNVQLLVTPTQSTGTTTYKMIKTLINV